MIPNACHINLTRADLPQGRKGLNWQAYSLQRIKSNQIKLGCRIIDTTAKVGIYIIYTNQYTSLCMIIYPTGS